MTYRASPADGCAWVTGASSGIGRAAALELARRGYQVFATARREAELEALALEAEPLRGSIVPAPGDVVDREGMVALVARIEAKTPIALALLNAGGAFKDSFDQFGGEGFQRTFALNVQGVANGVHPLLPPMRERRRGQIAIVGSIAGYGGLPNAYAYGPTKAAVISLAVGLRFLVERFNITVQVVNPGFIRTPMTEGQTFPMPFLMEVDDAARRLCDGLERGGFEIRFPRRLAWMLRALNLLPYGAYFALLKRSSGKGRK
jgi:NAD(P)-dependent dehydrogenase (short-subunit alcohol dehydrogenase family)